jgi:C1A family cysteine protease
MKPRKIKRYGWRADLPDARDRKYSLRRPAPLLTLPPRVDLRPSCPPVYDQGELGSCTANALAGALEFAQIHQNLPSFTPSRLWIYYNEREMEGTIPIDSGAALRDGIKAVAEYGVPPEAEWPYDITKFAVEPPLELRGEALGTVALTYERIDNTQIDQMRDCLAAGLPFAFGFTVYESFESDAVAQTGIVPMPSSNEEVLGGHAVLAVGYDDASTSFIVRNSWSDKWGQQGHFLIPYSYLTNPDLSDDFWAIQVISGPAAVV